MFLFSRLGPALRFLRVQRGLPQKRVAAASEITAPMLSSYENQRASPEIDTLDRILHVGLGASLEELAHALAVVNDRPLLPAQQVERGSELQRLSTPSPSSASLDEVLGQLPGFEKGAPLPPGIETGYAQIVSGLIAISRHVVEAVAEGTPTDRARGRSGHRR